MRRILPLFCLAMLSAALLAGCAAGQKYPTDNAYHPETDAQYTWYAKGERRMFAEAENGYYVLLHLNQLFYMDAAAMEPIPVCSKPNCDHTDKSCDSFFRGSVCSVFYNNGKLYVLENTPTSLDRFALEEVAADGSTRRTLFEFSMPVDYQKALVHRGKFYVASTQMDEKMNARTGIWQFDLARPSSAPKLLCEMEPSYEHLSQLAAEYITARGHYLYITAPCQAARLDLNAPKKGLEMLFVQEDRPEDPADPYYRREGQLLFPCFPGDRIAYASAGVRTIDGTDYWFNLLKLWDAEPLREAASLSEKLAVGAMAADDKYIYRLDQGSPAPPDTDDPYFGNALKIYDAEGNLLENIPLTDVGKIMRMLFVSPGEHVFFGDAQEGLWYICKSEIGSGNVQVHRLTDFGYLE